MLYNLIKLTDQKACPKLRYPSLTSRVSKLPGVNLLDIAGHTFLLQCSISLLLKNSHQQYANKWVRWCSNKNLFMNTKIWISYDFHMPWNSPLWCFLVFGVIFFSFNDVKVWKLFLACKLHKTGHRLDLAWGPEFLTPPIDFQVERAQVPLLNSQIESKSMSAMI